MKLIDENSTLIVETNTLRKDLKSEKKKGEQMKTILGLSHKKTILPKDGQRIFKQAVSTKEEIHREYQSQIKVLFISRFYVYVDFFSLK